MPRRFARYCVELTRDALIVRMEMIRCWLHSVFFSLNDRSEAAVQKMLGDCRKYLTNHPGILFFACGTSQSGADPAGERPRLRRRLADRLSIRSEAHDAYQDAPIHQQFISENKPNWRLVRVFDADIESRIESSVVMARQLWVEHPTRPAARDRAAGPG